MRSKILCAAIVGWILLTLAGASLAEDELRGFGGRAGYGDDPDQFVCGVQADLVKIYFSLVHFVPSIDVGVSDHMTTLTLNGDVQVFLPLPKSSAYLYGLAGPAVTLWSPENGDSDTEIGAYVGLGTRIGLGASGWYNIEGRFGLGDVPDLRLLIGVLF